MEKNRGNAGKGRKKGSTNKTKAVTKQALADLMAGNLDKMQSALDEVAQESPADFLKIMLALAEYNVPKLARVESTTEIKGNLPAITVNFIKP